MTTTWNPSDLLAGTLSNGNLTVTATGAVGGVRSVDVLYSGKYYWEYTVTNAISQVAFGVFAGNTTLTGAPVPPNPLTAAINASTGNLYINFVQPSGSPTLGTISNANIVGIAVDVTNGLAWFRICPSGNWNGNAANNPATGAGGLFIPWAGKGYGVYAMDAWTGAAGALTANFGGSAFSGALPSGFTSGFPSGTTVITSEILTDAAAEQWSKMVPPQLQLTAAGSEQWSQMIPPQLQATQVDLEQWATAIEPPMWMTSMALENWVTTNVTNPSVVATMVVLEMWAPAGVVVVTPPSLPGGAILLTGL
jgi:hypothetical protein